MNSSDTFQTPTLLMLICVMSAMAFLLSSYHWLWQRMRGQVGIERSFTMSIWRGQLFNFLFVMVLSIFVGIYDYYVSARPFYIGGEIVILGAALIFSYVRADKKCRIKSVFKYIRKIFMFGCVCLLGWAVTIGLGFSFAQILRIVSVVNGADFDVLVIFITGLLWNVPILWMFQRIVKTPDTRGTLKGSSFHKFLWPVVFAYLALLTPLMMQEIANSDGWKKMQEGKQIRKV